MIFLALSTLFETGGSAVVSQIIGAGFAVAMLMMCFIEYFMNATLLHYDAPRLLAAATIANIILTFVYLPLNGLDTGIQPLISRLFAAKR